MYHNDSSNLPTVKFVENGQSLLVNGSFLLIVPEGFETEEQLFDWYSASGQFPDYFGHNWDAFAECVADWHWLGPDTTRIYLVHEGLPFKNDMELRDTYLWLIVFRSLELLHSVCTRLMIVVMPGDQEGFDESFERWKYKLVSPSQH